MSYNNNTPIVEHIITTYRHTSKIRTREKPGPGLEKNPDSCLTKPGLDF